jgi:hypothetical protein
MKGEFKFKGNKGDVVDKRYKLAYKWEVRKKDRVGMDRW